MAKIRKQDMYEGKRSFLEKKTIIFQKDLSDKTVHSGRRLMCKIVAVENCLEIMFTLLYCSIFFLVVYCIEVKKARESAGFHTTQQTLKHNTELYVIPGFSIWSL